METQEFNVLKIIYKKYLNFNGLNIDEEKITNNKTNENPNSKSKKSEYSTKETHLN